MGGAKFLPLTVRCSIPDEEWISATHQRRNPCSGKPMLFLLPSNKTGSFRGPRNEVRKLHKTVMERGQFTKHGEQTTAQMALPGIRMPPASPWIRPSVSLRTRNTLSGVPPSLAQSSAPVWKTGYELRGCKAFHSRLGPCAHRGSRFETEAQLWSAQKKMKKITLPDRR